MCISGIYAFTNISILSVKNDVVIGAINIKLDEYTIDSTGKEVPYDNSIKDVLPGQTITLIPRIQNLGDSCYVRAKISYTGINNTLISLNENINTKDSNWIKCGDYWYYKKIVDSKQQVDIFKEFTIPREITNEYQGKTFQLNVVAEAVQSKNFEPKFDSTAPWCNIVAEKAIDNEYKTDKVQLNSNVKIEYENNADSYMNVPDNFFEKLGNILPGDIITDKVTIKNANSDEIEYFVSTSKPMGISDKAIKLIDNLELTIMVGNEVIYQGALGKVDNCSLGKYKPNTYNNVQFIVTVPKDLGNEFSAINAGVNWKFSANIPEKQNIPPKEEVPTSPQTGDVKIIIASAIFIISIISLIILCVVERKIRKKQMKI